jgi:hypothetical protein
MSNKGHNGRGFNATKVLISQKNKNIFNVRATFVYKFGIYPSEQPKRYD